MRGRGSIEGCLGTCTAAESVSRWRPLWIRIVVIVLVKAIEKMIDSGEQPTAELQNSNSIEPSPKRGMRTASTPPSSPKYPPAMTCALSCIVPPDSLSGALYTMHYALLSAYRVGDAGQRKTAVGYCLKG